MALSRNGAIIAMGIPRNYGTARYAGHVRVLEYNAQKQRWDPRGEDFNGNNACGTDVAMSADGEFVATIGNNLQISK